MKLKIWLKTHEVKVIDFAKSINVTKQAVYKWLDSSTFPRRNVLSKILKATNGDVTPVDFMRVDYEQDVRSTTELRP
jgi:predicted transcriptional regulator